MAKTVSISEDSIAAMPKGLPEGTLTDIFVKMLIQSDSSPLTDEEETSYKEALKEHDKGLGGKSQRCSARLWPRAIKERRDLERSHYSPACDCYS